jgi:hypothetical protein
MKKSRQVFGCIFLAVALAGTMGCLTTRGHGPYPEKGREAPHPDKKPPLPHK